MAAGPQRRFPAIAAIAAVVVLLLTAGAHALDTPPAAATNADPTKPKYQALDKPQEADELLIGWLGESYRPDGAGGAAGGGAASANADPNASQPQRRGVPRVLSWNPRVMHFPGFLSDEECDEIVRLAQPKLKRSGVVDSATGESKVDDVRSSSGQFFARAEHPVVARVEQRVALWTHLPVEFGEGMQVLKYRDGQEYRPHADYFSHPRKDDNGGNRMATVIMYLTTPEKGGETVFPRVKAPQSQLDDPSFSECAKQGLAVKARKGDAVLFFSIRPDGRFDPGSQHGGCPVLAGEKFAATKWLHVARFAEGFEKHVAVKRLIHAPSPSPAPLWCRDDNPLCEGWAEEGECDANKSFMVGTREHPGACLKSCGRCDVAAHLHAGETEPPAWCEDHHATQCPAWAAKGECEKNHGWMVGTKEKPGYCLRSCGACDLVADLYKDKEEEERRREGGDGTEAAAAA